MSMETNLFVISGRLGQDPEVTEKPNKPAITRFSVAQTTKITDSEGNTTERTDWFRVTAFNGVGTQAAQFLKKGDQALFQGKLRQEKWTDAEGAKRETVGMIADRVQFLSKKREA